MASSRPAAGGRRQSGGRRRLPLPFGRKVVLPGRGTTFVREAGSAAAPSTVLLIHGWLASAGLNWAPVFAPLGKHFRVIAADLRGHGRGIRTQRRFRLEDCADDLAALVDDLGCGPVIAVGYSMGGLIAQLLWRRRSDVVAGLVLCSTTRTFLPGRRARFVYGNTMNYFASAIRVGRMAAWWYAPFRLRMAMSLGRRRPTSVPVWSAAELRRHDMRQVLEAGYDTCQFDSRPWIGEVDVPTAVIVTTKDRAVPPAAQRQLAKSIADAAVHELDDDHIAFTHAHFAPVLVDACRDVTRRVQRRARAQRSEPRARR